MGFLVAMQFLTVIPLGQKSTAEEVGRSLPYFPLVGLVLGAFLWGLDSLLRLVFPWAVVNAFLVATLVVITGGLHLDGFMDTCDGVFSNGSPRQRQAVMRDSRTGAFAVAGAFCLLLLKYFSLAAVVTLHRVAALILMPVLGRWAMVYAVLAYPYIGLGQGRGRAFKEQANWRAMALASAITLVLCLLLMWLGGLVLVMGVWLVTLATAGFLRRRLGGLTGDTYGAINEVVELAVLLAILPLAGMPEWRPLFG